MKIKNILTVRKKGSGESFRLYLDSKCNKKGDRFADLYLDDTKILK